jgi:hypothetical protein
MIDLLYAKRLTFVASTPQTIDLNALPTIDGATSRLRPCPRVLLRVVTLTVDFNMIVGRRVEPVGRGLGHHRAAHRDGRIDPLRSRPDHGGASKGMIVSGSSKAVKLDPGSNVVIIDLVIAGCSAAS